MESTVQQDKTPKISKETFLSLQMTSDTVADYKFDDYVPMPIHTFTELQPLAFLTAQRIQASKYGMLEIFRHTYTRVEAILTMKRLSKKFSLMSKDPYLDNFVQNLGTGVFCEVRCDADRKLLAKVQRYAVIINACDVLNCEIYYKFPDQNNSENLSELCNLVASIVNSPSYGKLTIGAAIDHRMSTQFMSLLFATMKERKLRIKELVLDLQLYQSEGFKPVTDIDRALEETAKLLKDNSDISELVICHGVTCYPGTSLGLLLDGVRNSGLRRLSFQDIQFNSSWPLQAEMFKVERLEFFACKIKEMKLETLIESNKDLKSLVVQQSDFALNNVTWPQIGEALMKNPQSQLESIEWAPKLEDVTIPPSFWRNFCDVIHSKNSRLNYFLIPSLKVQGNMLLNASESEIEMLLPCMKSLTKSFSQFEWKRAKK